ncbi:MAG: N-acetyl sugar amidotransferase [Nitrospirae bacterium]|nr:N-acetyl sugar amidotransferase [Nitrospirota bacterium]
MSVTKYGLTEEVKFCQKCVMSNQRPTSSIEFKHTKEHVHRGLILDDNSVCDACRYAEMKDKMVDWENREHELIKLLDKHRKDDGSYDILVPGSGGKDSCFAAHILKHKYGMHPLTVTWAPHIYTDIGWKNFQQWINVGGFDNMLFSPNGRVHRLLTRLAFINLLHPFQPFILGQKNLAPKIALQHDIKLVFYGENEAEYGNPIADNKSPSRNKKYFAKTNLSEISLGGESFYTLIEKYKLTLNDLSVYLPPDRDEIENSNIEVHYLGYYVKWTPQEAYYYAVENTGFEANTERTEGTYTKFSSLDDRIDGFHYYTTFIKFGIGRATYDASKDIRNHHISREEGVALVKKYDGEFPKRYFSEILEYMDIKEEYFWELVNNARSPHLWEKIDGEWVLKHRVS